MKGLKGINSLDGARKMAENLVVRTRARILTLDGVAKAKDLQDLLDEEPLLAVRNAGVLVPLATDLNLVMGRVSRVARGKKRPVGFVRFFATPTKAAAKARLRKAIKSATKLTRPEYLEELAGCTMGRRQGSVPLATSVRRIGNLATSLTQQLKRVRFMNRRLLKKMVLLKSKAKAILHGRLQFAK